VDQVRIDGLLEVGSREVRTEPERLLLGTSLVRLVGSQPEGGRGRRTGVASTLLLLLGPEDRWLTRELRLLLPLLRGCCCCC